MAMCLNKLGTELCPPLWCGAGAMSFSAGLAATIGGACRRSRCDAGDGCWGFSPTFGVENPWHVTNGRWMIGWFFHFRKWELLQLGWILHWSPPAQFYWNSPKSVTWTDHFTGSPPFGFRFTVENPVVPQSCRWSNGFPGQLQRKGAPVALRDHFKDEAEVRAVLLLLLYSHQGPSEWLPSSFSFESSFESSWL